MRRLTSRGLAVLALALLIAAPSAAGKFGQKDLIGTWDADVKAMMEASGMMDQMPPGMDISQLLDGFSIQLTFDKDGTVTFYNKTMAGEETETDRFEVVSSEGNVLKIKAVDEEGTEEIVVVTFTDKDNITVDVEGEEEAPAMIFSRITKKAEKAEKAEKTAE